MRARQQNLMVEPLFACESLGSFVEITRDQRNGRQASSRLMEIGFAEHGAVKA
jgi:hypothetical protein